MNNKTHIFFALFCSIIFIACTQDKKNKLENKANTLIKTHETQLIKKLRTPSFIAVRAESFECKPGSPDFAGHFNITNIIVPNKDIFCNNTDSTQKQYQEIMNLIDGNNLIFNALTEYSLMEEEVYEMVQEGVVHIGENKYSSSLYYSGECNNSAWFSGKLIFSFPPARSLKGESLVVDIKGKRYK